MRGGTRGREKEREKEIDHAGRTGIPRRAQVGGSPSARNSNDLNKRLQSPNMNLCKKFQFL